MENKRTCLYDKNVALGALISPFGGFDMPIQYSNIVEEHNAVREACGIFDVSHMGRLTLQAIFLSVRGITARCWIWN